MRFGKTLEKSIYPPWKDKYIDYNKLKTLLHESSSNQASPIDRDDEQEWTEQDESDFVGELVNVQLDKVHDFQAETLQRLRDETSACEKQLEPIGVKAKEEDKKDLPKDEQDKILKNVLSKLDIITKETNELERYSRINYTGFLKAGKKHDRKRGQSYRVGPLLNVRLAALPFNIEDYSPLLYRLSTMYSFVRQSLDGKSVTFDDKVGLETYTAYKFWVHPENLLEVKTVILRRLPVLVYNPQTSKIAEGSQPDPTVTSIYFDNSKFDLYTKKVTHDDDASSLRLRWYGQLSDQTDILFEKKVINSAGVSEEKRFPIKSKYIMPFINGEYKMERAINKIKERAGEDSNEVKNFQSAVDDIQAFTRENKLEPIIRANYSRTAFEIPGDDRIRISLDTNLAFIREDAIDASRPCRDPEDWHRRDIDDSHLEYPFNTIHRGEIDRFPFTVLEIKIRGRKQHEWVTDLMSSHLVKEAPRFSKFIHGTANLFGDYVNAFPFWLGLVDTDIRTDPEIAYQEERQRRATVAQEDLVVGSLFGSKASPAQKASFRQALRSSPVGSPSSKVTTQILGSTGKVTADMTRTQKAGEDNGKDLLPEDSDEDLDPADDGRNVTSLAGLRALFPSFSTSRYAQAKRGVHPKLPPGVTKPEFWIKDQGPVRVEAKVWLANQRTFIKWQHVTVLLASLSLGLYNAAGANNPIARVLAVVYVAFAVFAGVWGYGIYMWRSSLIQKRSPRDFDNRFGPVVVCGGLALALVLNFVFKFQHAWEASADLALPNETLSRVLPHAGEL